MVRRRNPSKRITCRIIAVSQLRKIPPIELDEILSVPRFTQLMILHPDTTWLDDLRLLSSMGLGSSGMALPPMHACRSPSANHCQAISDSATRLENSFGGGSKQRWRLSSFGRKPRDAWAIISANRIMQWLDVRRCH